jgi:NAD(P)-dependent dehydrogenase (short-subunit alcohol dehydrogenase family)
MKAKVVVITGASAGVGRATVREFARHGASIGLLARGIDGLRGAKKEVEAAGGRALILQTDVADAEQVESAAEAVEKKLGPIDLWINNAMTSVFSPVKQMKPEEYQRVTNVTYLGVVHGTLSALRRMLPRDRGVILQVGSALTYRSIPLQSAYCAAKHAVIGFTDSLRCELYHDKSNVKLTVVQLPAMNTPQFGWVRSRLRHKAQPVPPIFQPEVAARAICWAVQHTPRELFLGGPTVLAIEGNKLAPGLADRYLGRNGYKSQQTDELEDPHRRDNLWEPVPGDHGAHGRFDSRAHAHSYELWAATHKWLIATAIAAGIVLAGSAWSRREECEERLAA